MLNPVHMPEEPVLDETVEIFELLEPILLVLMPRRYRTPFQMFY